MTVSLTSGSCRRDLKCREYVDKSQNGAMAAIAAALTHVDEEGRRVSLLLRDPANKLWFYKLCSTTGQGIYLHASRTFDIAAFASGRQALHDHAVSLTQTDSCGSRQDEVIGSALRSLPLLLGPSVKAAGSGSGDGDIAQSREEGAGRLPRPAKLLPQTDQEAGAYSKAAEVCLREALSKTVVPAPDESAAHAEPSSTEHCTTAPEPPKVLPSLDLGPESPELVSTPSSEQQADCTKKEAIPVERKKSRADELLGKSRIAAKRHRRGSVKPGLALHEDNKQKLGEVIQAQLKKRLKGSDPGFKRAYTTVLQMASLNVDLDGAAIDVQAIQKKISGLVDWYMMQ